MRTQILSLLSISILAIAALPNASADDVHVVLPRLATSFTLDLGTTTASSPPTATHCLFTFGIVCGYSFVDTPVTSCGTDWYDHKWYCTTTFNVETRVAGAGWCAQTRVLDVGSTGYPCTFGAGVASSGLTPMSFREQVGRDGKHHKFNADLCIRDYARIQEENCKSFDFSVYEPGSGVKDANLDVVGTAGVLVDYGISGAVSYISALPN